VQSQADEPVRQATAAAVLPGANHIEASGTRRTASRTH
jgi:hypothetical protein